MHSNKLGDIQLTPNFLKHKIEAPSGFLPLHWLPIHQTCGQPMTCKFQNSVAQRQH
jgi:hypothetical protein